MGRKRPNYPNTGWGREAEWEDIEKEAEPKRQERTPDEYRKTYGAAKQMLDEGKSREEIIASLDVPAPAVFRTEGGDVPFWAKVNHAVENSMVYVRKRAILDALGSGDESK
jgi:hypothetical protein